MSDDGFDLAEDEESYETAEGESFSIVDFDDDDDF